MDIYQYDIYFGYLIQSDCTSLHIVTYDEDQANSLAPKLYKFFEFSLV